MNGVNMKCRTKLVVTAALALCACLAVADVNGDDGWEWHDGSTLPQEGRGFSDTERVASQTLCEKRENRETAVHLLRDSCAISFFNIIWMLAGMWKTREELLRILFCSQ